MSTKTLSKTAAKQIEAKQRKQTKAQTSVAVVVEKAKATNQTHCTLNALGRENLQLQFGIGVNAFNSYVGTNNISVDGINVMREYAPTVQLALVDGSAEAQSGFYIVSGDGGLQGGRCERFAFEIEGKVRDILRHANGSFIFADAIKGLRFVSLNEVRAIAQKQNDLRQFKVIAQADASERVFAGALIGNMSDKRQALLVPTGKGRLDVVSLTTGRIGFAEKADRAVEIGALSDADKLTLATSIFADVDTMKGKELDANHARRTRKALNSAAKAAK